jgi:hypothetical protein
VWDLIGVKHAGCRIPENCAAGARTEHIQSDRLRLRVPFPLCHGGVALSLAALAMIYSLSLGTAMLLTGLLLALVHGWALLKPTDAQSLLRRFPRGKNWGVGLLVIAAIWSWLLIYNIDLGEFTNWRPRLLIIIPVAFFLTVKYVEEFLAARALGMVLLLAAEPLLEAAWLRPEGTRLFLVVLAYVWIVFGMIWIGMPYVLRDQIDWVTNNKGRFRTAALAGLIYGALLLILPLTLHRPA